MPLEPGPGPARSVFAAGRCGVLNSIGGSAAPMVRRRPRGATRVRPIAASRHRARRVVLRSCSCEVRNEKRKNEEGERSSVPTAPGGRGRMLLGPAWPGRVRFASACCAASPFDPPIIGHTAGSYEVRSGRGRSWRARSPLCPPRRCICIREAGNEKRKNEGGEQSSADVRIEILIRGR